MASTIGIDLGTTSAVCAVVADGRPQILTFYDGSEALPSLFAADGWHRFEVSSHALDPHTLTSKHLFEISSASEAISRLSSFEMLEDSQTQLWIKSADRVFAFEQMLDVVLRQIEEAAAEVLDDDIDAVIVVPDYFDDHQRQAVRQACMRVGMGCLRVYHESVAAGLYRPAPPARQRCAFYTFSGRSFSFSIYDIKGCSFELLATGNDTHIGGIAFDDQLAQWAMGAFLAQTGLDVSHDPSAVARLLAACERAKICLSREVETTLSVQHIGCDDRGTPLDLRLSVTREQLEALTWELLDQSITTCTRAIERAGTTWSEIDIFLLVGGQAQMPLVRQMIGALAKPPEEFQPFAAALGAARVGQRLSESRGRDLGGISVSSAPIGIKRSDGSMFELLRRYSPVPDYRTRRFTTSKDNQRSIVLQIYLGESALAADNELIGSFVIPVPRAPKGEVSIEVTFRVGHDMVSLTARDNATGQLLPHRSISERPPVVRPLDGRTGLVLPDYAMA